MKKILVGFLLLATSTFAVDSVKTYQPFTWPIENNDNGLWHWSYSGARMWQNDSTNVGIAVIVSGASNGIRVVKTVNGGTSWTADTMVNSIYRIAVLDNGDSAYFIASGGSNGKDPYWYLYKYNSSMTRASLGNGTRDSIGLSSSQYDSGSGSSAAPNLLCLSDSLFGVQRTFGGSWKSWATDGPLANSVVYSKLLSDTNAPPVPYQVRVDTGVVNISATDWASIYYGPNGWDTISANLLGGTPPGTGRNYNAVHALPAKGDFRQRRAWIVAQRPNGSSGAQTVTFYRVDITGNVGAKSASKTDSVVLETGQYIKAPVSNDSAVYTQASPRIVSLAGTDTLFVIYGRYSDTSNATGSAKSVGYKMSTDGGATFGSWTELKAASTSRTQHFQVSSRMDKLSNGRAIMWLSYMCKDNAADMDTLEIMKAFFTFGAGSPTIGSTPDTVVFAADSGQVSNPANDTFFITNTGAGSMSWTLSDTLLWLGQSGTSSPTTTETDTVVVSITETDLNPGVYHTPIVITATGATNTPDTIWVKYTITDISPNHSAKYTLMKRQ